MTLNKSYFVDPVLDENVAGFNCFVYLNNRMIERRFFRDYDRADNYGKEWLERSYKIND